MSHRMQRVAEQIRGEAARVLRDEVKDPRIRLVSLSRVDVSKDLSVARVYWNILDLSPDADVDATAAGLASAGGFVRSQLAARLPLRRMPELRFVHDASIAEGARTVSLIRELNTERERREQLWAEDAEQVPDPERDGGGADGGSA